MSAPDAETTLPGPDPSGRLRRAAPTDAALLAAWRAEPSAGRYQPLRSLAIEQLRDRLAGLATRPVGPELAGDVLWIVEAAGEPAGWLSLKDVQREHGLAAIGDTIGERFRGRGAAAAAVRAALPLAFGPDGADLWRLEANAAVGNLASRRVLERAGFRLEGGARGDLPTAGERGDHARYALLWPEWAGAAR